MTQPIMDEFTYLRQRGFYGTLEQMQAQAGVTFDPTGNDTVGEKLSRARTAADAWTILDISSRTFWETLNHGTFVYVKAVAGDSVDNSAVIQAAIESLRAGSGNPFVGGTLCFGKGRFRMTTTVVIEAMSIGICGVGPAGAATAGYANDSYGTLLYWDGNDTTPMFQVHNTIFFGMSDMTIIGNATAGKIPTAIIRFLGDGVGYPNAQMRIERCVLGKFTGIGAAQSVLLFDNQTNAQNDRGIIENCRIDGATVAGLNITGTQSVLHAVNSCTFGYNAIGVKTAAQITLNQCYFLYSTQYDLDISSGARVMFNNFASEHAYRMARLRGDSSLFVNDGYWQISDEAAVDRVAIDGVENSRQFLRLTDFRWTAFTSWAGSHPIISMKATSDSTLAQKFIEVSDLRWYVVGGLSPGITEAFFDVVPFGVNDSVTLYGSVQGPGASLSEGVKKFFHNFLQVGARTVVDLDRNDLDPATQEQVDVGDFIPPRDTWTALSGAQPSTQRLCLNFFTAIRTETISTITEYTAGTAAAATPTLCRMGIYTVAENGDVTLVASTPNDTALFASTFTAYAKALSAPYELKRGKRYAVGHLVVSAGTMPALGARTFVNGGALLAVNAVLPMIAGQVTGQSDLPGSVAAGSISGNFCQIGARLS